MSTLTVWDDFVVPPEARRGQVTLNLHDLLFFLRVHGFVQGQIWKASIWTQSPLVMTTWRVRCSGVSPLTW